MSQIYKTAKLLRDLALIKKQDRALDEEITVERAVQHFLSLFEAQALQGNLSCKLSCLLRKEENTYFCQTGEEDGFDIHNMDAVLSKLRNLGFKVVLVDTGATYIALKATWE